MKKFILLALSLLFVQMACAQPKSVRLWKGVPSMRCQPTKLYPYPAPDSLNNGISVVVCPGGSYRHLMGIKTEGFGVAEWLNLQGINAFVLRYRVGKYGYHHPAMIQDIQRAIQYVRAHSNEYHVDANKLGAMGFSAGGHLVLMAGAFADQDFLAPLGVEHPESLKPNFVVPVYPVVSMQDSIAHQRSRKNLLTAHYTKQQQDAFSMELQIPTDMPPTFLVTAKDDPVVMYQNSLNLERSLARSKVLYEFHLYETGGHGYGMDETKAPDAARWKYEFNRWVRNALNIF